jgi:hypothetical protein
MSYDKTVFTEIGVGALSDVVSNGSSLFWLLEWQGQIAVMLSRSPVESAGATPEQLVLSTLDGEIEAITFGRVVGCNQPITYKGIRSDDTGRLLMIANCAAIQLDQYTENLVGYDPERSATQIIYPDTPPIVDTNYFSPRKDGSAFVLSFGTLYSGLYIIDNAGAQAIDSIVSISGDSFNLRDAYVNASPDGYSATGNAMQGDWSPDGNTIAFLANVNALGRIGTDRIEGPWALCLLDTNSWQSICPLEDVYSPFRPRWSPNGRYIAFAARYGSPEVEGLWLFDVKTHQLQLVAKGRFLDFLWDLEDPRLVGIRLADIDVWRSGEVWTYELPGITAAEP